MKKRPRVVTIIGWLAVVFGFVGVHLTLNLAVTLIVWFFLFRPTATQYFKGNDPLGDQVSA